MPHRWAIATNSGTLIFADDADIIIEHHKSEPSTTTPETRTTSATLLILALIAHAVGKSIRVAITA